MNLSNISDSIKELNQQIYNKEHKLYLAKKKIDQSQNLLDQKIKLENLITQYQQELEKVVIEINNFDKNKLETEYDKINLEIAGLVKNKFDQELLKLNELEKIVTNLFPDSKDKYYTAKCINYLGINNETSTIWSKETYNYELWTKFTEERLITEAHKQHNNNLIRKNGPYNFVHSHDVVGDYNECVWDGSDKRCECGCKCPVWSNHQVNWLIDINLDTTYPVGKPMCSWSNEYANLEKIY
ncbi:hypothetical protein [Acanthamoeba polyphaga mimivirus]|uniref:Uncharacterized protein n=1 Tax=Acanthamoeba polyphaga mimivirus TaxID=212035 RepID=A0A2L2DJ48_MIMIV|nr:hypothetical protein [Acanthamoeba polyphaga mimivirus]